MPNFMQICALVNELWAINEIQMAAAIILNLLFLSILVKWSISGGRWQLCTSLQNFIYLRQSAAELLLFV